jgi:hypothetical protein
MTTSHTRPSVAPRLAQTAQLVLAALAAVAIAVASQGWPAAETPCDHASCAPSSGES